MEEAKSGDEAHRQWLAAITRKQCRDYETLEISRLELGGLTMFFFNAEVAQKYAAIARGQVPGALSAGYCNGMIGYLPTAVMSRGNRRCILLWQAPTHLPSSL